MTDRATMLPVEAPEADSRDRATEARAPAKRRRCPQFEKCYEAVDALHAEGNWPRNQQRDEQYDRACAWLRAMGYAVNRLPSRPTFSRAMLARERDDCP